MTHESHDEPQPHGKRPYTPPKLIVHGDLKVLAQAQTKGGTGQDGNKPSSRIGGTPG